MVGDVMLAFYIAMDVCLLFGNEMGGGFGCLGVCFGTNGALMCQWHFCVEIRSRKIENRP